LGCCWEEPWPVVLNPLLLLLQVQEQVTVQVWVRARPLC
jgi:hypothetical protein